ncbi:MAG: hypothetical protein GH148_10370 [Clostridia bacterium]|nr:hypothetical protein [Clostridia bacterium]
MEFREWLCSNVLKNILHRHFVFYEIFLPVLIISQAKGLESLKSLTSKGCGSILISIFLLSFNSKEKISIISHPKLSTTTAISIKIQVNTCFILAGAKSKLLLI